MSIANILKHIVSVIELSNTIMHLADILWGGAGGVLDHESRGKKITFHSFTMKIKTFHVSRRKTHANSTMTYKMLTNNTLKVTWIVRKSIRARGKVIIFRFSYFLSRNIYFYNSKLRLS